MHAHTYLYTNFRIQFQGVYTITKGYLSSLQIETLILTSDSFKSGPYLVMILLQRPAQDWHLATARYVNVK